MLKKLFLIFMIVFFIYETQAFAQTDNVENSSISVWLIDEWTTHYEWNPIKYQGIVEDNGSSGNAVTVTISDENRKIVQIEQLTVESNGTFSGSIDPTYLWTESGDYQLKVQYGSSSDSVTFYFHNGPPGIGPGNPFIKELCGESPAIRANSACYYYNLSGKNLFADKWSEDQENNSLLFSIRAVEDGILTVNYSDDVIQDVFMILVDGEEWNDYEIAEDKIMVNFPAGIKEIEIIGSYVIPEFGTIAMMILIVSVMSIIVMTRTKFSI